jgi:hypothetical protein
MHATHLTIAVGMALAWLVAGWGCAPREPSGDVSEEHGVPPHKPADLSSAIVQIERRFAELVRDPDPAGPRFAERLQEMIDIVRWLPYIAGESDLPEAQWNVVHQASERLQPLLQQQYARVQRGAPAELQSVQSLLEATLAELRQVASSQPQAIDPPAGPIPGDVP